MTTLVQTASGLPRQRLDDIEVDPTLPAVFQLSGGTTGVPKLIARTHNDYLYNSRAAAAINDIHADDALLMVLALSHNFPLASPGLQGFLMHGARIVLSTSMCGSTIPTSGDLMRRHPSGNYIVEGRNKDVINRGGEKISCAFVVLRPGMALTLQELTNFLLEKEIARFKLPERLEVLDELPLSRFGKVMKQALIGQAKALVAKSPSGQKP